MLKGTHLTQEHKDNISKAKKGNTIISEETKIKMSNAARGKPKTELHRKHISEGRTLKYKLKKEEGQ